MQFGHRGCRRHHRERMIRRAFRTYVLRWGEDEAERRERVLRGYNNLQKCSCYICGNPRRHGAGSTPQERRLLDAARDEDEDAGMAAPERTREIIEFVTADAYDDEEVMAGWGVALDDAAKLPFQATALGKPVTVLEFDSDARSGVRCEIEGEGIGRRWIGVDALDLPSLPPEVREVLDAFEAWSGGEY